MYWVMSDSSKQMLVLLFVLDSLWLCSVFIAPLHYVLTIFTEHVAIFADNNFICSVSL